MSFHRYSGYKDSEVEWLGEVPEHWGVGQSRRRFALRNERALEEDEQLTASQKHGIVKQADFVESEGRRVVEVIKGVDILKHVEPGDFVISMRSFQGGIEYSPYRGCISSAYVMLSPIKNIYFDFFRWLFKSDRYIQALQSTSNLVRDGQALRFSNFAQVDIPLVPHEEQVLLANFLDRETAKIDALIAEQQRLIELLQEKRQAVISHAVTKGLNPNAPMKDSGVEWLGEVPEHWEVGKLRRFTKTVKTGRTPDESDFIEQDGAIPWFTPGSFDETSLTLVAEKHVSVQSLNEGRANIFSKDAVLVIGIGATLGKVAVPGAACSGNQQINAIETSEKLATWFLGLFLSAAQEQMRVSSNASTLGIMNQQKTKELIISCPPLVEQEQIIAHTGKAIRGMIEMSEQCQRVVELLKERRSALISAAVTGQIDVRGLTLEISA